MDGISAKDSTSGTDEPVRQVEGGVEVVVWVVPGSRSSGVVGRHGDAVRIRVTQPPEAGRANRALLDLLSATLDAKVSLVAGGGGRRKRVFIEGLSVVEARSRLGLT